MKSLIIGMGFGNLYKDVLTKLGHEIVTVDPDPSKNASFLTVKEALQAHKHFDTANICTPNFLHEGIARDIARHCAIVFVEKPGLKTAEDWQLLVADFPDTRFMMVKNNQYRNNIRELTETARLSKQVNLSWINHDRVPNPGTWFTTKSKAFGGVSRDLLPHLLSLFTVFDPAYMKAKETGRYIEQQWQLPDLTTSDYGTVNKDGTYDVDDNCSISFDSSGIKWNLTANWKDANSKDRRNIDFITDDGIITEELGLCPEEAYSNMVQVAITELDNTDFWIAQLAQDLWIHSQLDAF